MAEEREEEHRGLKRTEKKASKKRVREAEERQTRRREERGARGNREGGRKEAAERNSRRPCCFRRRFAALAGNALRGRGISKRPAGGANTKYLKPRK